jgi:hypothetical protein
MRRIDKQMKIGKELKTINLVNHQSSKMDKGERKEHRSFKTSRRKITK